MKWSEQAWNTARPVYDKIITHPFIQGLIDGSLDEEKFTFYIQQDALYLAEYGKVLTAIASKLTKPEQIEAFIRFADDTMAVEKELHRSFTNKTQPAFDPKPAPGCMLYTSYLLRQLAIAPVEVVAAAVLPCFRIYKEVGDYILANQTKGGNPYQDWIDTYGGDGFEKSVKSAITICDELAAQCTPEQQQAMTAAYLMCSKMEWIFWDSAWRLEQWPV